MNHDTNARIAAHPVASATARFVRALREYNVGGGPDGPTDAMVDEAQNAETALIAALDAAADYRERLVQAVARLEGLAPNAQRFSPDRLRGKAEGVRLALSYLDEMTR